MENEKAPVLTPPAAGRKGRLTRRQRSAAAQFFRENYIRLLTWAMYMQATRKEAEDAIESAMIYMLDLWDEILDPYADARTAAKNELIKQRIRLRRFDPLSDKGGEHSGRRDHDLAQEEQLTVWEDDQWVRELLNSLPPRQQEVMALIVDEFRPAEIAVLLGKDYAAVRQNLLAARRKLMAAISEQRKQAGEGRA
jgi:RNA polymerase sigma factor (sigma-70 family)